MALVIAPSSSEALDVRLVGGKASSLAFLSQIEGVRVPPFFSVSARAFKASVSVSPDVLALVQELQPLEEYRDIEVVSKRLRETIKKIPLPAQLEADIAASYETLCKQMGRANVAVAVRSSATLEDLKDASFAGQHSTKLNIVGIADVLSSVRKCWASAFNARACEYRNKHKLPHSDVLMAVAVQVMIRPYAAGTGFSVELGTAFPGLHVASTYGVGEGLVSGDVTGDEFLFQRGSLMLIKRTLGSKTTQYVFNEQVSGIKLETVDAELAKSYSLPVETARSVARSVEKIEQVYRDKFNYRYMDTEFGVTKDGDVFTVYFLQARPVVEVHADKVVQTVDNTAGTGDVICEGRYGLMGAVYGRVHVVQRFEDLSEGKTRIEPDDILVTLKTGNAWTQYLKTLKALVTAEGSASSHPMLIGRERGIPVVVGVPDAIALLQPFNGDWVTLDGLKRKVFTGKQKLRDCTAEDLRSMFEVVPVMKMQSDEESKKFLRNFSRGFDDEGGNFWVGQLEFPVAPWCVQLMVESLPLRREILRSIRTPADESALCDEFKIVGNVAYDKMFPLEQTLRLFAGWTLNDFAALISLREKCLARYMAACAHAEANFDEYIAAYREFNAHKHMSWFFRMHLERECTVIANRLGVTKFHFDALLEREQARGATGDLDLELYRSIKTLALSPDWERDTATLETLARSYKLFKNTDINTPLSNALSILRVKIAEKAASSRPALGGSAGLQVSGDYKDVSLEETCEFFPEEAEFGRAVSLLVAARRQHCNAHHMFVRGQWMVRDFFDRRAITDFATATLEQLKIKLA